MTKWKELAEIAELSTTAMVGETAWTAALVWSTSKIPYVGIPIAALFGIVGIGGTCCIGGMSYFAYKDWYQKYCTK